MQYKVYSVNEHECGFGFGEFCLNHLFTCDVILVISAKCCLFMSFSVHSQLCQPRNYDTVGYVSCHNSY